MDLGTDFTLTSPMTKSNILPWLKPWINENWKEPTLILIKALYDKPIANGIVNVGKLEALH